MKCGCGERFELVLDRMHVLQGAKRDDHERIFLAQTEVSHVAIVKSYVATNWRRLVFDVRFQDAQHRKGIIHAVDGDAFASDGKQDAAGSAGNFQDWTARSFCQIEIER